MHIRGAREGEIAELSALVIAAKRHWGYTAEQMEVWRPDLSITAELLSNQCAFVAELEGRVVGFYSLHPASKKWALDHLWVLPECMHQGIGRQLLSHAQSTAASGRATRITIDADPNAESFYLACGAERVAMLAAPIAGQPDRVRPQLILPVTQSGIAVNRGAR